jgi:SAM-dependent methyltransferase
LSTVRRFAEKYHLADKAVLDIGSGRGHLQNVVEDFTGLDISPTVAPLYHKKFVIGSASAMPFNDNTFDATWSIWVFEHVPNPEQAFAEARRVTKSGGLLFLMPAWNCVSWAGEGYLHRPYSDFDLWGRLVKASLYIRVQPIYEILTLAPVRAVRQFAPLFGPTRLRYHRLTPNYEKYWQRDSDAVNSIDWYEAQIWFTSRGDECLNCEGELMSFPVGVRPLIIRVRK